MNQSLRGISIFLLLFISIQSYGQDHDSVIQWQNCYGTSKIAAKLITTKDGGFISFGGESPFRVLKLNSAATLSWFKEYSGDGLDRAYSIAQTADGGYVLSGGSNSTNYTNHHTTNGSLDFLTIKINDTGAVEWTANYGGSGDEQAFCNAATNDSGCIFAGYTNSKDGNIKGYHNDGDAWVVKLNKKGEMDWQKSLGGTGGDCANSIQQTKDGGYIVAGYTSSNEDDVSGFNGGVDCWVVKLDKRGKILWQKCFGGSSYDMAYCIKPTYDGGYIFNGVTNSIDSNVIGNHSSVPGGTSDNWVVKIDSTGNMQWQKCLGGSAEDDGKDIIQTIDSNYLILGYSESHNGNVRQNHGGYGDVWLAKLDTKGKFIFGRCFGGKGSEGPVSIVQTKDLGFLMAIGSTSSDGDVTCGNPDSGFYWLVKLQGASEGIPVGIDEQSGISNNDILIYPNPANSILHINYQNIHRSSRCKFDITDLAGRILLSENIISPEFDIDISGISKGIYLLKYSSENDFRIVKFVKQ